MAENHNPHTSDRDQCGRFVRGNRGGPGNPHARQTAQLKAALLRQCPPERMERIAEVFLKKAEEGDLQAAKFIFPYLLGKPAKATDPDLVDLHELELLKRENDAAPAARTAQMLMPAEIHLYGARLERASKSWEFEHALSQLAEQEDLDDEEEDFEEEDFEEEADEPEEEPSPNGDFRELPLAADAVAEVPPSANGDLSAPPPSPNGDFRELPPAVDAVAPPSANGDLSEPPPSPNGDFRRSAAAGADRATEHRHQTVVSRRVACCSR